MIGAKEKIQFVMYFVRFFVFFKLFFCLFAYKCAGFQRLSSFCNRVIFLRILRCIALCNSSLFFVLKHLFTSFYFASLFLLNFILTHSFSLSFSFLLPFIPPPLWRIMMAGIKRLWCGRDEHHHKTTYTHNQHAINHPNHPQTVKLIVVVIFLYCLCWLPVKVLQMLNDYQLIAACTETAYYTLLYAYIASHWLAMSNSFVNPIVYSFLSRSFRVSIKVFCFFHLLFQSFVP